MGARKLSIKKLVSVKNAVGKVTYTVKPANKKAKKLLKCKSGKAVIQSGKVIIKKKAKKGTYKFSRSKCQVILVTMQSTLRNKCVVEGTKVLKMTVLKGQ